EVLADGQSVGVRDFTDEQRSTVPPLRRSLSPRLIHAVKRVVPDTVTRRLYPLYWRLVTPATFASGVSHLNEVAWRIGLPADVVSGREAKITFLIEKSAPSVTRATATPAQSDFGVHLRSLALETPDRHRSRDGLLRRFAAGQRTTAAD